VTLERATTADVELVDEPRTRGRTAREVAAMWLATYPEGNTRDAYQRDLIGKPHAGTDHARRAHGRGSPPYFTWCLEQRIDPLEVDRFTITMWLRSLDGLELSTSTTARKVAAVRGFYRYAVETEILDRNPVPDRNRTLHVAAPTPESNTQGLTEQQVMAMQRAAAARSPRDAAVLALLYHQGLRASELCDLDMRDTGHDRGHRTLTVHGKGRKTRVQALAPPAARALDAYQAARTEQGMLEVAPALLGDTPGPSAPLIVDEQGRRLDRHRIRNTVTRYATATGVDGTITPHSLRHTCATLLLERGWAIRDVQVFLGHATSQTTERYDRRREHLDHSPAYGLPGVLGS
jgi:site-specific recombinase XerD